MKSVVSPTPAASLSSVWGFATEGARRDFHVAEPQSASLHDLQTRSTCSAATNPPAPDPPHPLDHYSLLERRLGRSVECLPALARPFDELYSLYRVDFRTLGGGALPACEVPLGSGTSAFVPALLDQSGSSSSGGMGRATDRSVPTAKGTSGRDRRGGVSARSSVPRLVSRRGARTGTPPRRSIRNGSPRCRGGRCTCHGQP